LIWVIGVHSEQVASATSILLGALPDAAELLVSKMQRDEVIALKVLQGFGVLKPPTAGGTSPNIVTQEMAIEELQEQLRLQQQRQAVKDEQLDQQFRRLKRQLKKHQLQELKAPPQEPPANAVGNDDETDPMTDGDDESDDD
jgi:hypothetical protein